MPKIKLFIKTRSKSRARIDSVPLKTLIKMNNLKRKTWLYRDGWLILNAKK